jgi:acyl-coenzyme A synthetase/AMP-(fatty) acid ligase
VEGDRGRDRRIAGPDVGDVDVLGAKRSPQGHLWNLVIVDDQGPRRLVPAAGYVGQLARARSETISINYTSGATGWPKGCSTPTAAYLNALNEVIVAGMGTDSVSL